MPKRFVELKKTLPLVQTFSFESVQLDGKGQLIRRFTGQAQEMIEDLGQGVNLEMVSLPKGFFQMGSRNEGGYEDELPVHPVFLDRYRLGKCPITQAQWQAVMGKLPHCRFHDPALPVETICWRDAATFCERLSKQTGRRYSLPSESQWEYACRAGTTTPFSLGENITTDYVNYVGDHTYRGGPVGIYRHGPVTAGTFPPNPWGLFDMHGNVWEFCADNWSSGYSGSPVDGSARVSARPVPIRSVVSGIERFFSGDHEEKDHPSGEVGHVARGGSWHEPPAHCRSAVRLRVLEDERLEFYGFRVMLTEP